MTEKLTAAEQAFEEWWTGQMKGYDVMPSLGTKAAAKAAYLAAYARATERAEAQLAKAREDMARILQTCCDADEADPKELLREIGDIARQYPWPQALGGQDDTAR